MRLLGEIPHPDCKITLFAWNNRYLLKFESGYLEQTYKINQHDISDERELHRLADEVFVQRALTTFEQMGQSLQEAMQRV